MWASSSPAAAPAAPSRRAARRSCAVRAAACALQPCRPLQAGRRSSDAPRARIALLCAATGVVGASASGRSRVARLHARRGAAEADGDDDGVLLSRSQLVSKSVITRTSGTNLGLVTQLWVDVDAWEVLALDVRPSIISGEQSLVALESLRQVGDVILVHDERAALQRRGPPAGALALVGSEVTTQEGTSLGRVRDYEFDPEDGRITALLFDALGVPVLPESIMTVYSLPVSEVVSAGPGRVIVEIGAETRVNQISASLLQRLKMAELPWEEALGYAESDEAYEEYYERYRSAEAATSRDAYYGTPPPRPALPREAYAEAPRQRADAAAPRGIPLVRRSAPAERRDADGRFGEAQPQQARQQAYADAAATQPFEAWVAREPVRQREEVAAQRQGSPGGFSEREDLL